MGNILKRIFGKRDINVYFISGMCYNCSVFDQLKLPKGFRRNYVEWLMPNPDETLRSYSERMAKCINTRRPFVLVGYSFGAVIMQEMVRFLYPQKCIVISSFKSKDEIPRLFSVVRRTKLAEHMPRKFYEQTRFITDTFNRLVYNTSSDELSQFMTVTEPAYVRWAVEQITDWIPEYRIPNLFHIHGTEDQVFPFKHIKDVMPVEGGDHLMLVKKADVVSALLDSILLMRP